MSITDIDLTEIEFRTGVEEAEKASKSGGYGPKTHYFSMEDKEQGYLRFITDHHEWPVIDQYSYVPTKPAPPDWEGKWPTRMGAVSRSDKAIKHLFEDDFIAEHMRKPDGKRYTASARTWAIACWREQVIGDGTEDLGGPEMKGKFVGWRDKLREVTKEVDGEKVTTMEKAIVIVNMGYKNFFSKLEGFARAYGTVLDRDYMVIRKGDDKDTDYQIAPMDPVPGYDLRDPEVAARYAHEIDLKKVILSLASDEFYGKFFDTRVQWTPKKKDDGEGGGASEAEQAKPDTEATPDRMKAMADRMKGYGAEESAAPAAESPAEPAAQPDAAPAPASGPRNFG